VVVLKKIWARISKFLCLDIRICAYHSITPDLDVERSAEELACCKWLRLRISTVTINTCYNEVCLALSKKFPAFVSLVGKVNKGEVREEAQGAGQSAFYDENPPPAGQAGMTFARGSVAGVVLSAQLHEAVSEDT
jgi:hypothetical protein